MKISLFTNYGALNSGPVFYAFEQGLLKLGYTVVYNTLDADVYCIWSLLFHGRMLQNKQVVDHAEYNNIPYIVLEVGSLIRNHTWKVGFNGRFTLPTPFIDNRSSMLGLSLKEWKKEGDYILLCGQHTKSKLWDVGDSDVHYNKLCTTIRKYTKMPIYYRPHPRDNSSITFSHDVTVLKPTMIANTYDSYDIDESLKNAKIVINWSSSVAVHAIMNGVPVITSEDSLAYHMATPLFLIRHPVYNDRTQWFEQICHTEWTTDELKNPEILEQILIDKLK